MSNPHSTNAVLTGGHSPESARGNGKAGVHAAEELRREGVPGYGGDRCVHQLFEAQVARTPDLVAVECGDEALSYARLDTRADRIARHLRGLGVAADVRVGICLERSLEMVAGLVGILKAGGAYVPLDPAYPTERLGYMLEDAGVQVLLTRQCVLAALPPMPAGVVCADVDAIGDVAADGEYAGPDASPENLAYVIYTSGSTGKPKGVALPHRALTNLIEWQLQASTVPPTARTLQYTSLSFDVSFQEIFSTLSGGGTLVLVNDELRRDPPALLRYLAEKRVERLFLPFVALQQLGEAATASDAVPVSLREIITAGEQLQISEPVAGLMARLPGCTLHNHYGPSESHVVTAFTLAGLPSDWPLLPPIGLPIANCRVHLLDRDLRPVPEGVPGELYIGGVCLARGYLGRPELTAERFLPDPFDEAGGGRLYRTGDLARYGEDGNILFLGRADHQVKIRGYRIEPGEIEAVLSQHPEVRESVVLAWTEGETRLVAYLVGTDGTAPRADDLRSFLRERLPEYMVPSAFVPLEALPLTPSGKVDRRSLPAPDPAALVRERELVAPRDAVEAQLVRIWEETLGVQPIGVQDSFFDLGGHSLVAVRLFTRIARTWGKELPLATLFNAPTVELLAGLLRDGEGPAANCLVPIRPTGARPPFFCLHGAGANVIYLEWLARHLDADQPFYGVQSQGLDGKQPPHTRVEEMAEQYLREIRAVQPSGPYYLGGYSFGGVVAFEMAQQLRAQGERVALLALLNSSYPQRTPHIAYATSFEIKAHRVLGRLERHLEEWTQRGPVGYFAGRIGGLRQKSRARLRRLRRRLGRETVPANGLPAPIRKVWHLNLQAEKQYVPQAYPGRLTLFWAAEDKPVNHYRTYGADTRLAWSEVAGDGLEVHVVPGDTGSMRSEPHVRVLAEKLSRCLERAQAANRGANCEAGGEEPL